MRDLASFGAGSSRRTLIVGLRAVEASWKAVCSTPPLLLPSICLQIACHSCLLSANNTGHDSGESKSMRVSPLRLAKHQSLIGHPISAELHGADRQALANVSP